MNFILILTISFIVMILLGVPSSVLFQNASALASVAQITSAKADGSDIANGAFATIAQGKTTVRVTFDYRGFDDNDHVLELRCSWDGVNYLKSNCSTESAESRTTFTGPDGVARAYYVKTGTASRDLAAPPVPKTFTFGVKVLNENGNLSPATTWSFKMRASTNPPVGGAEEEGGTVEPENTLKKIRVTFNSITVHDDHAPDTTYTPGFRGNPGMWITTPRAGEWVLHAFVQGNIVNLFTDKEVLSGKIYQFQGKQVTVDIKPTVPLSVFTIGYQNLESKYLCAIPPISSVVKPVFTFPTTLWKQKINELQTVDYCDVYDRLGLVNVFNLPPDYKKRDSAPILWPFSSECEHKVKSSTKDFTLSYSLAFVSSDRDHRDNLGC